MHKYFLFVIFVVALVFEIVERRKMCKVAHNADSHFSKLYLRDSNIKIIIYVMVIMSSIVEYIVLR